MNVRVIPASNLTTAQIERWSELQHANDMLDNPHFCPEFTRAVAEVRPNIEVAIVGDSERASGFLSFQRHRGTIGLPIAGPFSDFQGAVASREANWDAKEMLRRCGLTALRFETCLANQTQLLQLAAVTESSPFMDLSRGFEAYRVERRQAGTRELQESLRKSRKMEREQGALRFEADSEDEQVLRTLINWKIEQIEQMGVPNSLRLDWAIPLLHRILGNRSASFSGTLSALFAGEHLVAATFGMRSRTVLHGWLAAYNPDFRKYSPGNALLLQIAQEAESLGIQRIDMGRGPETYKRSFASGAVLVGRGSVDRRPVTAAVRHQMLRAKEWLRGTRVGPAAQRLARNLRNIVGMPGATTP
jgi:CelD/BcsL family acetyltransferase involved in cellulose biosynthesis